MIFTMDRYVHPTMESQREAANRLAGRFRRWTRSRSGHQSVPTRVSEGCLPERNPCKTGGAGGDRTHDQGIMSHARDVH
jgi:hypothetical protein